MKQKIADFRVAQRFVLSTLFKSAGVFSTLYLAVQLLTALMSLSSAQPKLTPISMLMFTPIQTAILWAAAAVTATPRQAQSSL